MGKRGSEFGRPPGVEAQVWREQLGAFEEEKDSIEQHRREARSRAQELLTERAQILILDFSQGVGALDRVKDQRLVSAITERQAGGHMESHADFFRSALGFEQGDPRVDIWKVYEDPDRTNIPYPDVWFTTGGPAMPSELHPGNETENTFWLQRAVSALQELARLEVPGMAVCLGHQLWEHSRGAQVGRGSPQREFGTVRLQGTDFGKELQLLAGFFDDEGGVDISASHSEGVITPPQTGNIRVVAMNDYSSYQAAIHGFGPPDRPIEDVVASDAFALSIQNHPEVLGILLAALRELRAPAMKQEGLEPGKMLFRDTPKARQVFLRFIEVAARRLAKRT